MREPWAFQTAQWALRKPKGPKFKVLNSTFACTHNPQDLPTTQTYIPQTDGSRYAKCKFSRIFN